MTGGVDGILDAAVEGAVLLDGHVQGTSEGLNDIKV